MTFQKWTIISLSSVAITLTVGLIILLNPFAHGQSDFYLEGKTKSNDMISAADLTLKVTKFEIQGNGSKQICPSLQCKVDYKDQYAFFSLPKNELVNAQVDFRLHDDITHADLGPKKKALVQQYTLDISCEVYDINEDNGQELYYCHNDILMSDVFNKANSSMSYRLNTTGTYDAKNDILKISGNFTK
jgi:hypothetical protein